MNSVNPNRTAELNAELFNLQVAMVQQNNLAFFKDLESFLKKYRIDESIRSFVVGEVFRHRDSSCVPQYHGDNFAAWLAKPAKKKVISINFDGLQPSDEFVLPESMKDSEIQKAAGSKPMAEQLFWLLLFCLIVEPELGKKHFFYELSKEKYYIFHAQLDSDEVVTVSVDWDGDEWDCDADRFDDVGAWSGGCVFVSLATAVA